MEKKYESVTFLNSIKDTFPYVESAIIVLDNNLNWWKKNYEVLEQQLSNAVRGIAKTPVEIRARFTVYSGPDENVKTVTWNGPAIEFTFFEQSPMLVEKVKNTLGNTWEGHKLITDDNKLIVLFE
jgi:hypothetical protein